MVSHGGQIDIATNLVGEFTTSLSEMTGQISRPK